MVFVDIKKITEIFFNIRIMDIKKRLIVFEPWPIVVFFLIFLKIQIFQVVNSCCYFLNKLFKFLNALISRALFEGSKKNIVACSPGRFINLI